jgi:hypothetical protein
MAHNGPPAPEAETEAETTVTMETAIPVVVHETAVGDVVVSFGLTVDTSSSQPQEAAALGSTDADDDVEGEQEVSWATLLSWRRGVFPLTKQWARPAGHLPRHRACSIVSAGVLSRSSGVFYCGPPYSRNERPLRDQGHWRGRSISTKGRSC